MESPQRSQLDFHIVQLSVPPVFRLTGVGVMLGVRSSCLARG